MQRLTLMSRQRSAEVRAGGVRRDTVTLRRTPPVQTRRSQINVGPLEAEGGKRRYGAEEQSLAHHALPPERESVSRRTRSSVFATAAGSYGHLRRV